MHETLRLRPVLFHLGLVVLLLGSACMVGLTAFAVAAFLQLNVFPAPRISADDWLPAILVLILLEGLSSLFSGAGLYYVWMYLRHELAIDEHGVRSRGLFGTRQVTWDEVHDARWKAQPPPGHIALRTAQQGLKIVLDRYSEAQAVRLMLFVHSRLPESVQHGWDRYWANCWRIVDRVASADSEPSRRFIQNSRRRMKIIMVCGGIAVAAAMAVSLSFAGRRSSLVIPAMGVALVVWALLSIFLVRALRLAPGTVAERHVPPKPANGLRLAALVLAAIGGVAWLAMARWIPEVGNSVLGFVLCLAAPAPAFLLLLWAIIREYPRDRAYNDRLSADADAEYLAPLASKDPANASGESEK